MAMMLLPGAQLCAPFRQGDLDSLCGLYSVINALRVVLSPHTSLTEAQGRKLLAAGLKFLERETNLRVTCVIGMTSETLFRLAQHLAVKATQGGSCAVKVIRERPARWSRTDIQQTIDAALEGGGAVIVMLGHSYEHFSVVVGASETRYFLFDSYRWHWISRNSLGTDRSSRRHRLGPDDLITITCKTR